NSYSFIFLFLPIATTGFFLIGRRSAAMAAGWMAFSSLVFYAWWSPIFLGLLIPSMMFNYTMGRTLVRLSDAPRLRTLVLFLAVAANLAVLAYFKYSNFLVATLSAVLSIPIPWTPVLLPLGISFFTFTQIAFLVDTSRGLAKEYSLTHYVLFVSYFPHLIAGPVLHHKEMRPQFGDASVY